MKNVYILTRRVHKSMHFLKTGRQPLQCLRFGGYGVFSLDKAKENRTGIGNNWLESLKFYKWFHRGTEQDREIEVNLLPFNIHNCFVAFHNRFHA